MQFDSLALDDAVLCISCCGVPFVHHAVTPWGMCEPLVGWKIAHPCKCSPYICKCSHLHVHKQPTHPCKFGGRAHAARDHNPHHDCHHSPRPAHNSRSQMPLHSQFNTRARHVRVLSCASRAARRTVKLLAVRSSELWLCLIHDHPVGALRPGAGGLPSHPHICKRSCKHAVRCASRIAVRVCCWA